MSRTLVQPVGQKRLTNVAVVRLRKGGERFEIACFPNTVLSWRQRVEKDLDEVLQSHTVYLNVSKGKLAKSKDLIAAFGTDDQTEICLEILEKGEIQIAGKERETQLASQFRDIATIVMEKTINTDTGRPYTIGMIERLLHEIHFAVDPKMSSKRQALDVIRELQKHFSIKRAPMRLRFIVPGTNLLPLEGKISEWNANIVSRGDSGSQAYLVCEIEPSMYRSCEMFMQTLQGRIEILEMSAHAEGNSYVGQHVNNSFPSTSASGSAEASECAGADDRLEKLSISDERGRDGSEQAKQSRCSTCDAAVGDARQYREHFKSQWHKHNLRRKMKNLPPLSEEECQGDIELTDLKGDMKEYSF